MTNKLYFVVSLLSAIFCMSDGIPFQCPPHEVATFEKMIGVRPSLPNFFSNSIFSFRHGETPSNDWLTLECIKTCRMHQNCNSVVVLYQAMECYGLPRTDFRSLTVDNDASLYMKICMQVPFACHSKLWTVESSLGHHLISKDSETRFVDNITSEECSRLLTQTLDGVQIASTQFSLPHKTTSSYIFDGNDIENIPTAKGRCALSSENKFTQPESYRVANTDTVYKENQCLEHFSKDIDRCSYEEYYNQTLKHYDMIIHGISMTECKTRCSNEYQFNCRGFTTIPYDTRQYNQFGTSQDHDSDSKICLLHSEDILSLGSWLLTKRVDAIYYRRVVCLNITVECTTDAMTVTYWPRSEFYGRVYVSGYSESCSASGQGGGRPTKLVVPFEGTSCGINRAYALADKEKGENRTLMYTMLVVQNNPIIQAQGDRFIRAGCVAAPAFNLTLGTAINVGNESEEKGDGGNFEGHSPVPASSIFNTTSTSRLPKVKMYIINEPDEYEQVTHANLGAVALGDTIELRIEMDSPGSGDVDIHAYHLVASSQLGDSSVLLLDARGCPTGQVDFPALRKTRTNGSVRLASRFKAFRFPNSHVVKFSVMVQFCVGSCVWVSCDGAIPQNRHVRSLNETKQVEKLNNNHNVSNVDYQNATVTFIDATIADFDKQRPEPRSSHVVVATSGDTTTEDLCSKTASDSARNKVPLELSLIVASNDVFTADSLVYAENNKILVSGVEGPRASSNMICIHEAIFITVTFVWLIVQILILAGCMVVVKRYRSFAEDNRFQKDYHSFDNLGFDSVTTNRRVHWPDQNVDILHVT